ncbi:MAG: S1 RNA-binding domain-containing protein [Chloroherpetonaceae bacterium]|nr:S1 RNA-binding domain-containing protein [Chthonomonadaceae bacterium]MDW8208872.1 S1 RNA-binding domain-containing protein [Chloroherpetonaceae bacterium]
MSDDMVQEKQDVTAVMPDSEPPGDLHPDNGITSRSVASSQSDPGTTPESPPDLPVASDAVADTFPDEPVAAVTAETECATGSVAPGEPASGPEEDVSVVNETPAAPETSAGVSDQAMFEQAMQNLGQGDMGQHYEESFRRLQEGDVIEGIVMRVDKREGVMVDVGAKSEGIIRLNELSRDPNVPIEDIVKVGEKIRVYVLEAENQDGIPVLSKKRADFEQAWERVLQAKENNETIMAMVQDRIKGGLVVDLGIRGFVPASHVGSGSPKNNLDRYVGQSIPLKVIEVDKERRKVVLSNKLAEQEIRARRSAETRASLEVGQIRTGIVRRITPYGAFIDLGGIDGLLHISEMSWTRINDPREVVREGQEIDVIILKLDLENDRVSLGLRQILPDPWQEIPNRYSEGDVITGTVTRIVPFGAFVQVDGGIEGIIPNSELPRQPGGRGTVSVNVGDEVQVKIIGLKPEERKMTLSMRALQPVEEVAPREPREPKETRPGREGGRRARGRSAEREEDDDYTRYIADEPRFTIGDVLGEQLAEQRRREKERRRAQRYAEREEEAFDEAELDVEITEVESDVPEEEAGR